MGALFGSLGALSIGMSDLFARRVVRASSALTAAIVVSVMAIATSLAAVAVFGSTLRPADLLLGMLSGLGLGTGLATYYGGLARSSSTVVTPVVAVIAAIIPYTYALLDGVAPSSWAVVGATVAIGGLLLITVGGAGAHHIRAGVLWGIVSGVGYGIGFAVVIETSAGAGAWPAVGQRVMASVMLVGVASHRGTRIAPPIGARVAAILGGMFAGSSTVLYLAGIRADATAAVITTSMFPAASVAIGWAFFHDTVSRLQLIGIGVVLAGIAGVVAG